MTHDELASSLAQHLLNDSRMVWENIPAGPAGSVRPDVLTIEKSFTNPNPISYEIKVTKSDFLNDVAQGKWMNYQAFSYGVVFASRTGLIAKGDIPNGCGLVHYNGEFWRTVKRPVLTPRPIDSTLLLKLLIEGASRETHKSPPAAFRTFNQHEHNESLMKKFGKDMAAKIALLDSYPEKKKELHNLRTELGELFGVPQDKWCFEADIAYHIKHLKILANETERKSAIAAELEALGKNLSLSIERMVERYT